MEKVTYLFGAGASYNVLPVVDQLPDALSTFTESLVRYERKTTPNDDKLHGLLPGLIQDYKWLAKECAKHSSVDTFAKKLFIRREQRELNKLKLLLSLFFAHRQSAQYPDKRYDSFFASIIRDSIDELPPIKILSWNYDSQFELSFNEFTGTRDFEKNQKKLGITTKFDSHQLSGENFGIFKINGTTSFGNTVGDHSIKFYYERPMRINEIPGLLHYYNILRHKDGVDSTTSSNLSFAWEPSYEINPSVQDTTTLVVIGYSFPFFNRDVDKKLLKDGMPILKKVYFQDPAAESVRERFLAIRDDIPMDKLLLRTEIGQFLLPDELSF